MLKKIKLGSKVKVGDFTSVNYGRVGKVVGREGLAVNVKILHKNSYTVVTVAQSLLILLDDEDNMTKRNDSKSTYSFEIRSLFQLDDSKMHDDLSYANPFAYVQIKDKHCFVLHDSIFRKAVIAKNGAELLKELGEQAGSVVSGEVWELAEGIRGINKIAKIVRKIKDAPFLEEYQCKATVKVRYINV